MSKVIVDISMSLDGFITAANRRPEEPMGDGGQRLHAWALDDEDARNRAYVAVVVAAEGGTIAGRETYDSSLPWWGADGPPRSPENGVYTFVTGGIARALELAKATAGEGDISVMGGGPPAIPRRREDAARRMTP